MPHTVESAPPRAAAALALAAVAALLLAGCASVQVRSLHPDHGPQLRAHEVTLTFTKELP